MSKVRDLTGQKFGRLTVVSLDSVTKHRKAKWLCKCDCGKSHIVDGASISAGKTKSCGCLRREATIKRNIGLLKRHGMHGTPEHYTWNSMRQRCENKNAPNFKRYGGRGISVCERWAEFENFLADMGERPDGLTLDRIDNNGDYTPENCRWATRSQQQRNRSNTCRLTLNGLTLDIYEWAERTGIKRKTIYSRICSGWSTEKALTTPVAKNR
jgi:hypothetical protein